MFHFLKIEIELLKFNFFAQRFCHSEVRGICVDQAILPDRSFLRRDDSNHSSPFSQSTSSFSLLRFHSEYSALTFKLLFNS